MPLLTVSSLSKRFGQSLVLDRLSFEADSGVLGIAGRNGSGKTTLLRCLAGLVRPSGGRAEWRFGDTVADRAQVRANTGFSGPWLQLYREMSCHENMAFLASLHGLPDIGARCAAVLDLAGLHASSHRLYGQLSSGQQQRLKLASALVHDPRALILDEPGTNLDEAGHAVVGRLADTWRATGRLLILASNDPHELDLCDRVVQVSPSST